MNQTSDEAACVEDAALTRAAQAGEVTALGLLLERHRAGMRAVALSILGPGPDVDDVVQDAAVTALRRVGDVRDPAAVGAWLRMIVRNASRSLLRSSVPAQPIDDLHLPATDAGPERWLEQHAMRDWKHRAAPPGQPCRGTRDTGRRRERTIRRADDGALVARDRPAQGERPRG